MVDKINLSLDDIIKISKKTNKSSRGRGAAKRGRGGRGRGSRGRGTSRGRGASRGRGGFGGRGVARGGVTKSSTRRGNFRGRGRGRGGSFSRSTTVPNDKWDHDMFTPVKQGLRSVGGTTRGNGKLLVSNLDFGVSDSDLSELFSEFGALRRAAVHYDRSGRSLGSADVHFERRNDAVKAINQYNGVPLDGRAMQIRFVDGPAVVIQATTSSVGGSKSARNQSARGSGRGRGRGRGGARGRGGRGRGRGGGQKKPVSIEELDKQLDEYISKND